MVGLIGRKLGMTQIFTEDGALVPVTVIEAGPCPVVQVKTKDQDGYDSIQVGFEEVKERRLNSPRRGHLKKHGAQPMRFLREFRVEEGHEFKSGDVLTVEKIEVGSRVDVISKSKGRGFQGVVKRHGFHGGPGSHGSKTGDLPGSVGQSAYPNRVFKGKKLPGHMGDKQVTVLNLRVVRIDTDRNLVLVRGAVPGAANSLVTIRPAIKQKKGK
ncbi:MAG: 50S ribosomal protein L3 [Candidatus Eisenbacteria bacterium]|uniref:Large ribosomal subunit protein uL3 n=1 Tax=Eiseniibacteriota bacterium TaxID=2212470 RepID=A0A956M2T7_UNCEI|nr:50S ribosomal protein L3 [Candidatus Eisenbacteria bacterium]